MSLDIRPNSTFNSTNLVPDSFTMCKDMYEGTVFWACFTFVNVLCGFPACVAVLWELLQRHRRGVSLTPNDVFMLNITVFDLVFLGYSPFAVFNHLFWHILPLSQFDFFITAFTITGRPLIMTCVCLDCYLAVVHPITYRARNGLTARVLVSIGVWAFTLGYGALRVFFFEVMTSLSVVVYVLTILTIGICDFFIVRALKRSDPGGRDPHPQKKKALQIIVNSLVMTAIAYIPPMLTFGFYTLMSTELKCRLAIPLTCNVIAGSAVMPVLYLSNLNKLDFTNRWCCKAV